MTHLLARADSRRIPLADRSVHCVVTSPPYWSLRDYGTGRWVGGDPACDHLPSKPSSKAKMIASSSLEGSKNNTQRSVVYSDVCGRCGAHRHDRQLGLEATPSDYVAAMVAVFREIRRVLRDDGTVWLNLGDSYASGEVGRHDQKSGAYLTRPEGVGIRKGVGEQRQHKEANTGLPSKNLLGIPWRVALALQADGWYLRMDLIWAKPNPMPESITDRPTRSHEYLFMLSKSERYFWDQEAVRSPHSEKSMNRYQYGLHVTPDKDAIKGSVHDRLQAGLGNAERMEDFINPAGRNMRSVLTIATEAFPGAHFATFPRKLVEPCVLAGTSERGVCPKCGAPWGRVVERTFVGSYHNHEKDGVEYGLRQGGKGPLSTWTPPKYLGWQPSCSCYGIEPLPAYPDYPEDEAERSRWDRDHDEIRARRLNLLRQWSTLPTVPAVVCDIFAGSGTTGVVALAHGRRFIGLDLSVEYLAMAQRRISRPHAPVQRPEREEFMPLFERTS